MKVLNSKNNVNIPDYVSSWTDEYFHKSAFDIPIRYPSNKTIDFLSRLRKSKTLKLFRGVNKYNAVGNFITSWTYDKKIAKRYIATGGKIIEKNFTPDKILLDTTVLNAKQKMILGYDYTIDDKEVLIIDK